MDIGKPVRRHIVVPLTQPVIAPEEPRRDAPAQPAREPVPEKEPA